MKIIYNILSVIALLALLTSCDKMLDLAPEDVIVEDDVFKSFLTSESALAGTYHLLFKAGKTDYTLCEATASTCGYSLNSGRYTFDEINDGTLPTDNGTVQGIYESYYKALNQANLLIFKIDELGQYEEIYMKQHIAESKFIRAYSYHRLLSWFGDGALTGEFDKNGVVLYLEHYDGFDREVDIRPRNSNGECYNQIIKDLKEAIVDLPEPTGDIETIVSRANKATCEALLTRVYLYKQDYDSAIIYANKFLSRSTYELEDDLHTVFPQTTGAVQTSFSDEHIFGFPVSTNNGDYLNRDGNGLYYYFGNIWLHEDFMTKYSVDDLRRTQLTVNETNPDDGSATVAVTRKYPNRNDIDNITIMRLPEIMLANAEALVQQSESINQDAIDLLNDVYLRSNLSAVKFEISDFTTFNDLLDTILLERAREFAFEGMMRFDQIRTEQPLYNSTLADNKKVLPIPRRDIEISNGILEQNEGYINQ